MLWLGGLVTRPTDGNWLNTNAFFNVCVCSVIGILTLQDLLSTEGIDESGAA